MAEVEVLRAELYESDVTIEGEYMSDQQMEDEGFSESPDLQETFQLPTSIIIRYQL